MTSDQARSAYEPRLTIPACGLDPFEFFTPSGLRVALGFTRVVFGGRGPYLEFADAHVIRAALQIPSSEAYRLTDHLAYYVEYRSRCASFVKFYFQRRRVDYADYRPNLWYASPFELRALNGSPLMRPRHLAPSLFRD